MQSLNPAVTEYSCHPSITNSTQDDRPSIDLHVYVYVTVCSTCLFQAMPVMSSRGCGLLPGLIGLVGELRSQMKISDSPAPEARRLGWKGLTSSDRTAPTC